MLNDFSIVNYLNVSFSTLFTSVWEERADFYTIKTGNLWFPFGGVSPLLGA